MRDLVITGQKVKGLMTLPELSLTFVIGNSTFARWEMRSNEIILPFHGPPSVYGKSMTWHEEKSTFGPMGIKAHGNSASNL